MGLMSDADIVQFLQVGKLITGPAGARISACKGAAVELTVGDIFVPGAKEGELGSPQNPREELCLKQGQTAVLRSAEEIHLDQNHAGIAFPAAIVSLQGLLMTNPGYIDPGYVGYIHVTVINMGSEAYPVRRGLGILRCLLFGLDSAATLPYPARQSPITLELLQRLSADFMNIEGRAATAAKREVTQTDLRTKLFQFGLPVVVAIIGVVGTVYATSREIEARLTKLELSLPTAQQLDTRLTKMEALLPIEQRVEILEKNNAPSLSPGPNHDGQSSR